MPDQTLHCAFAIDDGYSPHLGATLASVLENNRSLNVAAHVITLGVSEENKKLLREMVAKYPGAAVSFYEFDAKKYAHFRVDRHISLASYIRLFLGELLPADVSRVLYLDCDLAILADLKELYELPMDGCVIAAAGDFWCQENEHERLGLEADYLYFNAGVLLIDLTAWRTHDCQNLLVSYVERNQAILTCHDQDALNACLGSKVKYLDTKWNFQAFFRYYHFRPYGLTRRQFSHLRKHDKRIVHYTTPLKPWFYASDIPFEEEYLKYLAMTPWKDYRQQGKNFSAVVGRYWRRVSEFARRVREKVEAKLGVPAKPKAAVGRLSARGG